MATRRLSIPVFIIAILLPAWLGAQPDARITTISAVRDHAESQLTLFVRCDSIVQYMLTEDQISLTDNGLPVEEFSIIESASPAARNAISAALVFDASGSMMGNGNAGAKTAGKAFVDLMDGTVDEGAVLWFNTQVNVQQQMTTIKPLLKNAIDALPVHGATAVWDAAMAGLQELAANGINAKRAVVLLTDGADNSSTHQPSDVIQLAQQLNLRVFAIGLGAGIQRAELQAIALATGGLYFETPNAYDLQTIFTTIATFMKRGFDEHTIAYTSPDPTAVEHTISISIEICGSRAEDTHTEEAFLVTDAAVVRHALPSGIHLGQNVPNPFSGGGGTTIPYRIDGSTARHVTLEVFDLLGRRVATLVDSRRSPGSHTVQFASTALPSGMYLCRLSSGRSVDTRMLLLR